MLTDEDRRMLRTAAEVIEADDNQGEMRSIVTHLRALADPKRECHPAIRIAVAVNDKMEWSSAGWTRKRSGDNDQHFSDCASEGLGGEFEREHVYFIEAPLIGPPLPQTVKAELATK